MAATNDNPERLRCIDRSNQQPTDIEDTDALREGDTLRMPDGRLLDILDIDRQAHRPDRFNIAQVDTWGRWSHRDYDLQRALDAGAVVLR